MKVLALILFWIIAQEIIAQNKIADGLNFFPADDENILYTGRISFANTFLPRFWQPGTYFNTRFEGSKCEIILNDQLLWSKNHNYLEIEVDGKLKRIQTTSAHDTIVVAKDLSPGVHSLLVCKNTEANIGYIELAGIRCRKLLKPFPKPSRKIEFIGNSITCGTGSDQSEIPCGKGVWQDQHNAYLSYGATTARRLNAQWMLSAVSGIGLIHSCCNMDVVMPQVFDNIDMRGDSLQWDFSKYQPDVVTVCLGQNDGKQDSVKFCNAYINFIKTLRGYYPSAQIILLTSPMADEGLTVVMKKYVAGVKKISNQADKKVDYYFFSKRYYHGCDTHPDLAEHKQIAKELSTFIKKKMKW